jgi:hypothetical protein
MKRLSRFALWINRIVLSAVILVFTMIGIRYIANPVSAAAATGAVLNTPLAATTTRIGFGAFPLAIAAFAFTSLLSSRRLVPAVRLVVIVMSFAIIVRAIGMVADGAVPASSRLFVPESVILLFALAGLFLQRKFEEGAHS